jgi:hypothetical protein
MLVTGIITSYLRMRQFLDCSHTQYDSIERLSVGPCVLSRVWFENAADCLEIPTIGDLRKVVAVKFAVKSKVGRPILD